MKTFMFCGTSPFSVFVFCSIIMLIFCLQGCIDFINYVYVDVFGFTFKLNLSTRPEEGFLGDIATWFVPLFAYSSFKLIYLLTKNCSLVRTSFFYIFCLTVYLLFYVLFFNSSSTDILLRINVTHNSCFIERIFDYDVQLERRKKTVGTVKQTKSNSLPLDLLGINFHAIL